MKKSLKKALLVLSLAIPTLMYAQGKNEGTSEEAKFWGGSTTCGTCVMGGRVCQTHYYVFWIDVAPGEPYGQSC